MKKAYVMLENNITGMGGGQMYTRNKLVFMSQHGWEPFVFSGIQGEIVIGDLQKYKKYIFPALASPPIVYSVKTVEKTLTPILNLLEEYDDIIIESGSGHMALWGETIAVKLQCKHMVHLLDERNDLTIPEEYLDFYRFKLRRRELSGITDQSLNILFRNNGEIDEENNFFLSSVCQNVIDESSTHMFELPNADKTVCCIGRLEKPYVMPVAHAFAKVVKKHPSECFNVIFIGGTSLKNVKSKIKSLFQKLKNARLILTGDLYPIPKNLFQKVDVFASSAGSAGLSYRQNKPTISIDGCDLKAIGVVGYTTQHCLYRDCEEKQDIADLLEKILYKGYLEQFKYTASAKKTDLNTLNSHMEFISQSEKNKEYYSLYKISPAGKDLRKRQLCKILGDQGYIKFRPILARISAKRK